MKLDITSSAIEKGIDIAKSFLEKLIGPTVEETGLLIKDQISSCEDLPVLKASLFLKTYPFSDSSKLNNSFFFIGSRPNENSLYT